MPGLEGNRLNVKPIQVLKMMVIACLICVFNSIDLTVIKAILVKLCTDTELLMVSKGRHKSYEGNGFPGF